MPVPENMFSSKFVTNTLRYYLQFFKRYLIEILLQNEIKQKPILTVLLSCLNIQVHTHVHAHTHTQSKKYSVQFNFLETH